MITATSIELFKNLIQYDYDGLYYDFHNDYICEKLSCSNGILRILLKSLVNGNFLSLKFLEVKVTDFIFFNVERTDSLTLDNLYRGRFEFNGELIEVYREDFGYFYLEFYEGQKLEFWAKHIDVKVHSKH